jgi:hypothetical protein
MLRSSAHAAIVLLAMVAVTACGKRGAPLAPIVRIPAAVQMAQAQRVGNDIFLSFTLPARNIDGSMPIDIARVDVYGYTGFAPPPADRFVEAGTRVASFPVMPPSVAPPGSDAGATPAAASSSGSPAPSAATAGMMVSIVDTLDADELVAGKTLPALPAQRRTPAPQAPAAAVATTGVLHRYYLIVPFSVRERPGPQPPPLDVALFATPPPPQTFDVAVAETVTTLTWEPAGGLVGFLLESGLPPEPAPGEDVFARPPPVSTAPAAAPPTGPTRYNVYRTVAGTASEPGATWLATRPLPINPMPLAAPSFTYATDELGVQHCYVVRSVRGEGASAIEGAASAPFCYTPLDRFPPQAPAGLVAVAAERSISLIWEPSSEADLAGYVVLRGTGGSATLQRLTSMPITEARFIDTTVQTGTTYVYAVVAVDTAMNLSPESNRVEETGR